MQNIVDKRPVAPGEETPAERRRSGALAVPVEWIAYAVLIGASLVLRLAGLGDVPMTAAEVPSALGAWAAVSPFAPFTPETTPGSPLVFQGQMLTFTLLGGSELAARLVTALGGVLLGLLPLMFRAQVGATRAFVLCALLTLSPVALIASRFSSGTVWAVIFGLCGLCALWRAVATDDLRGTPGMMAVFSFALMAFFSGAGGLLLALILIGAGLVALVGGMVDPSDDNDAAYESNPLYVARRRLAELPLLEGGALSAVVIAALATTFLIHTDGLSTLGGALGDFIAGWGQSTPVFAYPLVITLVYEPILVIFALIGLVMRARDRTNTFSDRLMVGWLALALLLAFAYGGARADHALLMTVPLVWFASYPVARLFYQDRLQTLWAGAIDDPDAAHLYTVPWGKWLIAVTVFGVLFMLMLHLQTLSRQVIFVEGGTLGGLIERLATTRTPAVSNSLLWAFITSLFLFVGYFLCAGIWERVTTLQGYGLGLLGFMLVTGLSSGWYGAAQNTTNPVEPWHMSATTDNYPLLRQSLIDFSRREFAGEPVIGVAVVQNPVTGITRDGVIAWALRDFPNARFVESLAGARREALIIASPFAVDPLSDEEPDLGGGYVGQRFVIERRWNISTLQGLDFMPWLLQRRTRWDALPSQEVILWARQDVYHSGD